MDTFIAGTDLLHFSLERRWWTNHPPSEEHQTSNQTSLGRGPSRKFLLAKIHWGVHHPGNVNPLQFGRIDVQDGSSVPPSQDGFKRERDPA